MNPLRQSFLPITIGALVTALLATDVPAQDSGQAPTEITIDTSQTREPISPYIYGQFIEHLGRCIYGGIWAEMLEDRKFHFPIPAVGEDWRTTRQGAKVLAASPWHVIGQAGNVAMVEKGAFSGKHSPHIRCSGNEA